MKMQQITQNEISIIKLDFIIKINPKIWKEMRFCQYVEVYQCHFLSKIWKKNF